MATATIPELWPDKSLYEILGIEKTATAEQVKKAYYKQALKYHPDKAGDDPAATKRFQALCAVHAILSDKAKRADYDRTGEIPGLHGDDGEINEEAFEHWYDYWRAMFPPVTVDAVKDFETKYRGSEEERKDVIAAYSGDAKGDMDTLLTLVMCSNEGDADRFVAIIHDAIAKKEAKPLPAFTKVYGATPEEGASAKLKAARGKATKQRSATASAEAAEADRLLEDLRRKFKEDAEEKKRAGASGAIVVHKGGAAVEAEEDVSAGRKRKQPPTSSSSSSSGSKSKAAAGGAGAGAGGYDGEPSLADLIRFQSRQRNAGFASMVDDLEARYGGGGKGKGGSSKGKKGASKAGKKAFDDDDDDDDGEESDDDDDSDEDEEDEDEEAGASKKGRGAKKGAATKKPVPKKSRK